MPLQILSPIHKASRQIGLYFEPLMEDIGIQPRESHLVSYLRSYAPCPIGELSRVFGFKRSTLTSMLDRLEVQGVLERRLDIDDRRSFLVELTADGERLADRINRIVQRFEEEALRRLRPRDLTGFRSVMGVIADITGVEVRPTEE